MQAIRLFCFPHAGGGPSAYRPWLGQLGPEIEVVPVALPGRETRIAEPAHDDMAALVEQTTRELADQLTGPYAFFGHSMGASVAWAMARVTRPLGVIASARRAPQAPLVRRSLTVLSDEDFMREIGELNGTPKEVLEEPELVELLLPTLRADFTLSERFQSEPGETVPCPLLTLAGTHDPEVDAEEIAAWEQATSGTYQSHVFEGGHFYLSGPNPDVLATIRAAVLEFRAHVG